LKGPPPENHKRRTFEEALEVVRGVGLLRVERVGVERSEIKCSLAGTAGRGLALFVLIVLLMFYLKGRHERWG
jgi:hypothetical protein